MSLVLRSKARKCSEMDEHIVGFGHFMRFVVNKEIMEQHQLYHLTFSLPSSSSLSTNKRKDSIWVSLWHVDHNLGLCCWSSLLYNRSTGEHWRNLQLHLLLQQLCGDRGAVWWTPQCVDHCLQWQLHHEQGARRSCSDWYVRCFISFIVPEMMWYHRCSLIVSCLISPLSPVPCTPTNISVSVDCSQDTARFNWTTSIGAIFYIAVAEDANGNLHSCNAMGTNCLMEDLRCGQNYTASIIGTNLKCNSTASEEVTFMTGRSEGWVTLKLDRFMIVSLGRRERDTRFVLTARVRSTLTKSSASLSAPCPPTNIEAFRDCDANHALIIWQNHQPTGLYTAIIEDQSRAQLNCTSNTVNNCKITSLPCGRRYNVTVTYNDGNCPSTSTPISMDSGS